MTVGGARKYHDAAWKRLLDLVSARNKLLRHLDMMARPSVDSSPTEGFLFEFDTAQARELLAAIDELTPRITAAMEEANTYAEKMGLPRIRWQSLPRNWGT